MTKDGWMYEGAGRFWTVFPLEAEDPFENPSKMPQDFPSRKEAKEYGDDVFGEGNYTIEEG